MHIYKKIITKASNTKEFLRLAEILSQTSSNVLITGESGTGKELVARAIHFMSERKNKPFVAVNCGAVPEGLMEGEFFGYEKGAFTGAHARKIGKFEYADGGTIVLDEISTLSVTMQVKLLRALQERSFERIGSNTPIKVNIRVIAIANVDLKKEVRKGTFREDLYYRLNVVPIEVPPLRERKEDIPLLVQHFMDRYSRNYNKTQTGIAPDAIDALTSYHWPGNVRELENLMERFVVLSKNGATISFDDLPVDMFHDHVEPKICKSLKDACRSFEKRHIIGILNRTNWNKFETSKKLNIHRNTLLMKMQKLGIKEPDARSLS